MSICLVLALAIGAFAALAATPMFWRMAEGLARWRRGVLAVLSGLGLAGLGAAFLVYVYRERDLAAFTLGTTLLLQAVALPVVQILTSRKG